MNTLFDEAFAMFGNNRLDEALLAVNQWIAYDRSNLPGYLLRARIYSRMQNWGNAMNDYMQVLEMEPENQEAKAGLEMVSSILTYFTPDMFNP